MRLQLLVHGTTNPGELKCRGPHPLTCWVVLLFLRQGLVQPRTSSDILCSWNWPSTFDPPASTFQILTHLDRHTGQPVYFELFGVCYKRAGGLQHRCVGYLLGQLRPGSVSCGSQNSYITPEPTPQPAASALSTIVSSSSHGSCLISAWHPNDC